MEAGRQQDSQTDVRKSKEVDVQQNKCSEGVMEHKSNEKMYLYSNLGNQEINQAFAWLIETDAFSLICKY